MDASVKPKVNRLTNAQVIRLADWLRMNAAKIREAKPSLTYLADEATAALAFPVSDQQLANCASDCGVAIATKRQAEAKKGIGFLISQMVAIDDRLRSIEQQLGVEPGSVSPALRAAAKHNGSLFPQE